MPWPSFRTVLRGGGASDAAGGASGDAGGTSGAAGDALGDAGGASGAAGDASGDAGDASGAAGGASGAAGSKQNKSLSQTLNKFCRRIYVNNGRS